MPIRVDYKDAMRDAYRQAKNIEKAILATLAKIGEEFARDAKHAVNINKGAFPKGDYTDQTANLRNSIGYIIYKDSLPAMEKFEASGEGVAEAKRFLATIPKKPGYVLVGVAGMNYASYLEAMGYNVITSQSFVAIDNLTDRLKKLSKKSHTELGLIAQGRSSAI